MKTILSRILGVSKALIEFIWPLITKQAGASLAILLPIAYEIVKNLAKNDNISNSQKREEAFDQLYSVAKKEGMQAKDSLINLAIEMAVNVLKDAIK